MMILEIVILEYVFIQLLHFLQMKFRGHVMKSQHICPSVDRILHGHVLKDFPENLYTLYSLYIDVHLIFSS